MTDSTHPLSYGVWLPSRGWLKAVNPKTQKEEPCAWLDKTVADQQAKWFGGRVLFIDDSIGTEGMEKAMRDQERNNVSVKERIAMAFRRRSG